MSAIIMDHRPQGPLLDRRPYDQQEAFPPPHLQHKPPQHGLLESTSGQHDPGLEMRRSAHRNGGGDVQRQSGRRQPDWNDFYKNGLPQEVIVIEDTPEPSQSKRPNDDSGYHTVVNTLAPSKKRKIDENTSYERTGARNEAIGGNASISRTKRGAPVDARSSGSGVDSQQDDFGAETTGRRKRARLEPPGRDRSLDSLGQPQAPQFPEFRGLRRPAIRSKDVPLRSGRAQPGTNLKNLSDDTGHFNVVADMEITRQYNIKKKLGQGTFGKVVQATDRTNGQAVAIKIIRSVQKYRDAAKIELRVLQTLRQNDTDNKYKCIHLRDCFDFHGHTCIVTDLLGSSLFDFLKGNEFVPFPNSHILHFAHQLLTSCAFLHDIGLIHTDLKPENILLEEETYQTFTYNRKVPSSRSSPTRLLPHRKVLLRSDIRLIDFGSATFQDEYHSSVVSTRHYRAPEIILGLGWSFPCDIWSIGCILVEFFTGDALFQTHDNIEHLAMMEAVFDTKIPTDLVRAYGRRPAKNNDTPKLFKRLKLNYPNSETSRTSTRFVKSMKKLNDIIPPTNTFLRNFLDLLRKMFIYDPAERITAKQALRHPWFKEIARDDGTEAAKIGLQRAQMMEERARAIERY